METNQKGIPSFPSAVFCCFKYQQLQVLFPFRNSWRNNEKFMFYYKIKYIRIGFVCSCIEPSPISHGQLEHYLLLIVLYDMEFQSEAELLAEKRCVAHLTGEVHVKWSYFFLIVTSTPSASNICFIICRVPVTVIYLRTQCFQERCKIRKDYRGFRHNSLL